MSQIILDIGSGNTITDIDVGCKLIDEVIARNTHKHDVVFKTQLFQRADPNKPLSHHVFSALWAYAIGQGYKLTSSVFDKPSLEFLLKHDNKYAPLPFVKIACRPDLYWLIGEVPRRIPVYRSVDTGTYWDTEYEEIGKDNTVDMVCVPEYPAALEDYNVGKLVNISDHTIGLELFNTLEPRIWEKHICLERDPNNPDSGPFAILPKDLEEIL